MWNWKTLATLFAIALLVATPGAANITGNSPVASKSVVYTTPGANNFTVPPTVSVIWITKIGGGSGGAGGHTTGGAGGGGAASGWVIKWPVAVTPGSTVTCTVGAKSAGGAIGNDSVAGGATTFSGGLTAVPDMQIAGTASQGGAVNGGSGASGGGMSGSTPAGGVGDADGGAASGTMQIIGPAFGSGFGGGAGAGTGSGNGGAGRSYGATSAAGGANVGGGGGGGSPWGIGGAGGATTTAGTAAAAASYGAGGGGGGQNAAGGAGADGMCMIEYIGANAWLVPTTQFAANDNDELRQAA